MIKICHVEGLFLHCAYIFGKIFFVRFKVRRYNFRKQNFACAKCQIQKIGAKLAISEKHVSHTELTWFFCRNNSADDVVASRSHQATSGPLGSPKLHKSQLGKLPHSRRRSNLCCKFLTFLSLVPKQSLHFLQINTAMALTSLSNAYLSSDVNRFFNLNGKVTINATLLFLENSYTSSVVVKRDIQKKLLEVIQARNNNVGNGNLYVDSQLNPIPGVADVNECSEPELHDCDAQARCINRFGSFDCVCLPGYGDRFADDPQKAGRYCESCSADYCYGRGTCLIKEGDQKECECKGNYYGNQCEIDGEVVAVAVGASVAAVVIIILTLTCLCLWR